MEGSLHLQTSPAPVHHVCRQGCSRSSFQQQMVCRPVLPCLESEVSGLTHVSSLLKLGLCWAGPARIRKWYQAVVVGSASAPGSRTVTDPVLGAAGHAVPAETVFTTRRRAAGLAWLDCKLVTGGRSWLSGLRVWGLGFRV